MKLSFGRQLANNFPAPLKRIMHPESYFVEKFVIEKSKLILPGQIILDAGAGEHPYESFFGHAKYESCDFDDIFSPDWKNLHTYLCDLEHIPTDNERFDAILNTQVLEHVSEPEKVLKEFNRILKPGGKLFLTCPQSWGIHGKEPHSYFNFTKYGLRHLFEKTRFEVIEINPIGGMPWLIGTLSAHFTHEIFHQIVFKKVNGRKKINLNPIAIFMWVPYIICIPITTLLIPLICYFIDRFDKERKFTLGYTCYCTKHEEVNNIPL